MPSDPGIEFRSVLVGAVAGGAAMAVAWSLATALSKPRRGGDEEEKENDYRVRPMPAAVASPVRGGGGMTRDTSKIELQEMIYRRSSGMPRCGCLRAAERSARRLATACATPRTARSSSTRRSGHRRRPRSQS